MKDYHILSILFEGIEDRIGKIYSQAEDIVTRGEEATSEAMKNEAKAWKEKMRELEAKYPDVREWAKKFKKEQSSRRSSTGSSGYGGGYRYYGQYSQAEYQQAWRDYEMRQAKIQRASNITVLSLLAILLLIRAGAFAYEQLKKKGDDKCAGLTGINRKACKIKIRIAVYQKQIQDLRKQMVLCNKTKDKEKCKRIFTDRINKIQSKIDKLKQKLSKLKG